MNASSTFSGRKIARIIRRNWRFCRNCNAGKNIRVAAGHDIEYASCVFEDTTNFADWTLARFQSAKEAREFVFRAIGVLLPE